MTVYVTLVSKQGDKTVSRNIKIREDIPVYYAILRLSREIDAMEREFNIRPEIKEILSDEDMEE